MVLIHCDRCEKPVNGNFDDFNTNRLYVRGKGKSPKDKPAVKADLCDECVEAVKDFVFDHGTDRQAPKSP